MMTSPRARPKSDMDIEKHREEGNWLRCLELSELNGTEQKELQNFLTGEANLELFLEEVAKKSQFDSYGKTSSKIDGSGGGSGGELADTKMLDKAKDCLKRCLEAGSDTPLIMDANLLLAKSYYVSGDYQEALNYIRMSNIDSIANIDKNLPLRVIKLIAESFTVKGMSLEKINSPKSLKYIDQVYDFVDSYTKKNDNKSLVNKTNAKKNFNQESDNNNAVGGLNDESYQTQIDCLTRATALTMRYVNGIEKSKGPHFIVNLGCVLESALLNTHHVYLKRDNLDGAIGFCRRILNHCETKSTVNIRQVLAKELAEILLKGMSRSSWKKLDSTIIKQQQNPPCYFGQSLFVPNEYEEEVMLLLLISEALASLNVLLERSSDVYESRIQSLNRVLLIQDLFTMFLIPNNCYYVECFERSMKYSYEVKHVWYQFALTLMESRKCPFRSFLLLKEVIRMDPDDPVPNLFAAKLCMFELANKLEEAIALLEDALARLHRWFKKSKTKQNSSHNNNIANSPKISNSQKETTLVNHIQEIYGESNLEHHIHLMLGVANALVYESDTETSKKVRKTFLDESIRHLNESIHFDQYGNNHLPYFHLALHLAHQRVLPEALRYVRVSLWLAPNHLSSLQLLILILTGLKQYDEAYELCKTALKEYSAHLVLLYIKAHLEKVVCESGTEVALLTAKELLRKWRATGVDIDSMNRSTTQRASYCSFVPGNYDTMSLRMEQALSEVISLESTTLGLGVHSTMVGHEGNNGSLYIPRTASNISDINTGLVGEGGSKSSSQAFEMQIWILIVELFLLLDQVNEAETCVTDGAVTVFGHLSHQLMYIKGLISKKRGQYYDAKIHFQNAISINPKHARALQHLGHTFYMLGNQISAEKYLKDSINIDSTLHKSWSYLGLVLDEIGEHERASECHLTAIHLESTSPLLPFSLVSRYVLE